MKYLFLIFFLLFGLFSCNILPNKEIRDKPHFWIWLGHNASYDYDSVFFKISSSGFNGVLFRGSPSVTKKIIPIAQKYNLMVHSWKWIMNADNKEAFNKQPEWASVNRLGFSTHEKPPYVGYYQFMCPALPEVRDFIYSEIDEYLQIEDLGGISLDYCRYVDVILPENLWSKYDIVQDKEYPEWDYGYHPYLVDLFMDKYGYDPKVLETPAADSQWVQFREHQVNEIAWEIARMAGAVGKKISASPFPSPTLARKHVRQDWGSWNLDLVFPMIYTSFYKEGGESWFRNCLKECQHRMSDKNTKIYPGLYAPGHRGDDFSLNKAMKVSLNSGASGFAVFSYVNLNESEWTTIQSFTQKYRK
jgi:uncharacterized lipoprotein YddW (UPF0748 family)